MEAKVIYQVIKKLTGRIRPVCDSAIDSDRYDNMQSFISVFNSMLTEIRDIANGYHDSQFGSARSIGKLCQTCIDDITDESTCTNRNAKESIETDIEFIDKMLVDIRHLDETERYDKVSVDDIKRRLEDWKSELSKFAKSVAIES